MTNIQNKQGGYSRKALDYFKNPRHAGELENPDGVGKVGNPVCGDVMHIFIKVKDSSISEIRFKTFGCVAAISSSEALCVLAEGKELEEAEKITNKDILEHLEWLPPVKMHCSVLGAEGLHEAIKDYREKHKKA